MNHHLLRDLTERDLWDDDMKNQLIANNGSIQNIEGIPDDLKALYKTVWEISQKTILNMAADRGAFIDQSQSLNVHMTEASYAKLSSMHFHGWKIGEFCPQEGACEIPVPKWRWSDLSDALDLHVK